MRRVLATGIAGCFAFIASSQSFGQTPKECAIRNVQKTEAGLDVYFVRDQTLHIADRQGRSRVVMTASSTPPVLPSDYQPYAVRAATAALGEKLYSDNSPEDGCSMTVVTEDGRIGIEALAFFNSPGVAGASKKLFIPAARHSTDAPAATSGTICWISRVEEAETGVNVFFASSREINIANPGRHTSRLVWTNPESPVESSGDQGAVPVRAASAVAGETLSVSGTADDSCKMMVTSRAGKLGIETADWFMAAQ